MAEPTRKVTPAVVQAILKKIEHGESPSGAAKSERVPSYVGRHDARVVGISKDDYVPEAKAWFARHQLPIPKRNGRKSAPKRKAAARA